MKSISKIDYEKQSLFKKGIVIYDLRKIDDGNYLKKQIKSDLDRNFACVVKLSNKHYVTLFIESKKPYKYNYDLRYIYVVNSAFKKINLKMLHWFTGVMNQCVYKFCLIERPKQRLMSEDSLLHAYFNAAACQWASNNHHWEFLKKNFYRQEFSSKENIQKLKQLFIEITEKTNVLNYEEDNLPEDKTIEIIEKFKNQFSKL
ncbi:unnamed protein product, partial [Rotaria sp. Silwood2]